MFRRRQRIKSAQFRHSWDGARVALSLTTEGKDAPFPTWASLAPSAIIAISEIEAALSDQRLSSDGSALVEMSDNGVRLHSDLVASMDVGSAASVGFPPPTTLALDIRPVGRIDQDSFHIQQRWVRPGGQPIRTELNGPFLTAAGGVGRVPQALWQLYKTAAELALPTDKPKRFEKLSHLKEVWPSDPKVPLTADVYLEDLRVHYASSLSLKLKNLRPDLTSFDPVLFGAQSLSDAKDANRELDEELDSVLSPAAQKLFAEDRFKRQVSARPVYVLRDGEYVFIDPSLRPALEAVRELQDAPEKQRREFVLNPRRVLRERLGPDALQRIDLDQIFVETEQFSERVAGVDVWRKPVLPWLMPSAKNRWIPEKFGLRVGDDYFVLPAKNVPIVSEKLTAAAAKGDPAADVTGLLERSTPDGPPPPQQLPVNDQTISAVNDLQAFSPAPSTGEHAQPSEDPGWNASVDGKLFLVVRDNFEEVEYSPLTSGTTTPPEAATLPVRLKTQLKPHQVDGFAWLAAGIQSGQRGALLADDMGLGKTIQAIAFMAWLQDRAAASGERASPFLIVAPTGLLGTWKKEIEKHLDDTGLGILVPAFGADLKQLKEEDSFGERDIETGRASLKGEEWRDAGVVLTTYETMRDYHFSFARTRFGLIVFDEIQKLKNPASQVTRAAKALNSDFFLGMTGTPVENRLQDLWSIMDVIIPGALGSSRDFERRYVPTNRDALATLKKDLTEPRGSRPAPILRRLKSDQLKGLPAKHVHRFELPMPSVQANAYRDLVIRAAAAASAGTLAKGGMLSTLAAMRGVSLHPADPRNPPSDIEGYARDSARLSQVLGILTEIALKSEKALIFVEDLAMQERLAGLLQSHFKLKSLPLRINGSVSGPRRQEIVDAFELNQNSFDVMILSPKAGGVGLTITSANHVIHLSRWWNPAVEDQATDRVFRIGQTREVHVYLPMAVHPDPDIRASSFDLCLDALIERKRTLTRDLFLPPEPDDGDLNDLFREVSLNPAPPKLATISERSEGFIASMKSTDELPNTISAALESHSLNETPRMFAQDPPEGGRATLSLPKSIVTSGIRLWKCRPGRPRPTAELVSLFAGKRIRLVSIQDPYAIATSAARSAQVEFVRELKQVARSLDAVTVEYAPEVDGPLDDSGRRRAFGSEFVSAFSGAAPKLILDRRSRRGRDDDFHDRFVELDVQTAAGTTRRHEITIGRGLEALFDDRWQCTVTYAPPGEDA